MVLINVLVRHAIYVYTFRCFLFFFLYFLYFVYFPFLILCVHMFILIEVMCQWNT